MKVNLEKQIADLNNFCKEKRGKVFTGAQFNDTLIKLGFAKTIAGALAQKCFPYEKMGTSRLYEIPKNLIYIGVLSGIYKNRANNQKKYNRKRSNKVSAPVEKSIDSTLGAWDVLIKAGKVRQKLNIVKLKKDYPLVYAKCLEYEIINEN